MSTSKTNDNQFPSLEDQLSGYKTKDSQIEQEVDTSDRSQNKTTIATALLYMLSYSCGQQSNFLQMIIRHFLFANNVPKRCMESLYQIGVIMSSKTICQALKTNTNAILNNLQNHSMQFKKFFLSYNNMNFHKRVCN